VLIREERPEDVAGVRRVNEQAFGQPQEAALVDALRAHDAVLLSLVALDGDRVVGHVLYSAVRLESGGDALEGAGLAPMAVLPELQRTGIGSELVARGALELRERGCPFIVVLGHPEYYPRFGFVPASRHGVRCPWEVPDEVFLLLPLDAARLPRTASTARYRDEFSSVTEGEGTSSRSGT